MTDVTAIGGRGRRARRLFNIHALRRGGTRLQLSLAGGVRADEPVTVAFVTVLVLSLYFALLPGVDMAVSALFYSPGAGFILADNPVLRGLRKSSTWVLGLMLLGLIGEIVLALRRNPRRLTGWGRRAAVLIAGLVIASGFLVNGVLKSMWGRARPIQIEGFGGDADFTRAWQLSDNCLSNCSFVSGEGSSAAWMVAVAVLMVPAPWRRWALPAVMTYAAALSINRIAFGGHFLSDILLSWALTGLVIAALHRLALACPRTVRQIRRARRRSGKIA
ncbi:phosphatase PAP2 family protein [Brevundimonas sp.]|uniref:phosphatase PAP2 family protein n=1 Tax=Brevundimonas sp. TaxID=1871086 RepID=UPI00286D0F2F|nr:phosphatase PAP2 family protein [Brevundimonas sp.]